jgi:hypothetical protein
VLGGDAESLVSACLSDLRNFDCYRVGSFTEIDARELEKCIAKDYKTNSPGMMSLIEELRKRESKREQTE